MTAKKQPRNGNLRIPVPFEDAVRAALQTPPPPPEKPKKPRTKKPSNKG